MENEKESNTTLRKKLFLDYVGKTRGVISAVCEKLVIPRATYYNWCKTDPEFDKAVKDITKEKNNILEDRMYVSAIGGDFKAIKFLLEHSHPKYKKKKVNNETHIYHHMDKQEPFPQQKTFTTLLWEEAKKRKEEQLKAEMEKVENGVKVSNLSNSEQKG